MKQNLRIAWIMGWAIPRAYFEQLVLSLFPEVKHTFIEPTQNAISAISKEEAFDFTVGYSLGSLLLLNSELPEIISGKKVLLAPILGFTSEMKLGGKIPLSQLRYTQRLLRTDAVKTVNAFYQLSGLVSIPPISKPYTQEAIEHLVYGLKYLEDKFFEGIIKGDILALSGDLDALLDSTILRTRIPDLNIISNATHDPVKLIESLSKIIQ